MARRYTNVISLSTRLLTSSTGVDVDHRFLKKTDCICRPSDGETLLLYRAPSTKDSSRDILSQPVTMPVAGEAALQVVVVGLCATLNGNNKSKMILQSIAAAESVAATTGDLVLMTVIDYSEAYAARLFICLASR